MDWHVDFVLLTIGLGLLIAGSGSGYKALNGSPLLYNASLAPTLYFSLAATLVLLIWGFIDHGWLWIFGIAAAWLPFNYFVGNAIDRQMGRATLSQLTIIVGFLAGAGSVFL